MVSRSSGWAGAAWGSAPTSRACSSPPFWAHKHDAGVFVEAFSFAPARRGWPPCYWEEHTMITEQHLQAPDAMCEQRRNLDGLFHAFLERTASVGVSIAALMLANAAEPEFDRLCQLLERDCS